MVASKTSGQASVQAAKKGCPAAAGAYTSLHTKPSIGQVYMNARTLFAVAAGLLAALTSIQADWPQWRGPGGQGHAEAAQLPDEWSEAKNVTWRTELPGRGWSSPVIFGNQIWVTAAHQTPASEEEKKERLK